MKTLDEQIADAENTLEQARASADSTEEAKSEARLGALKEAKEFHTKEFERVGKKIRSEGGDAKEQEIANEFGVSIAEAKEIIAEYNASQEALENEADKERKLRETAEKERDDFKQRETDALKLADDRLIQADLTGALRDEGIQAEYLPLALQVADTSTVEVNEGKVENIPTVVADIKKRSPVWFGTKDRLPITPEGDGDADVRRAYRPRYLVPGNRP